jgi:hypothetical protein
MGYTKWIPSTSDIAPPLPEGNPSDGREKREEEILRVRRFIPQIRYCICLSFPDFVVHEREYSMTKSVMPSTKEWNMTSSILSSKEMFVDASCWVRLESLNEETGRRFSLV